MSGHVVMEGLAELREQLRRLPEELKDEAQDIVLRTAQGAAAEVVAAYPQGPTGNLKRGVRARLQSAGRFGAGAMVISRAPHASIYEFGTRARQTEKGANRGRMPKPKAQGGTAMIPRMQRLRAQMIRQLIALVQKAGFEVSQS
jgi:hypothetical protein